jgi:hypothetical protein
MPFAHCLATDLLAEEFEMTNLKNTLIRTAGVAAIALLATTGIASATITVDGTYLKATGPGSADPFSQGLLNLGTSGANAKNNGFTSGTTVGTGAAAETITFTNGTNGSFCFGGCSGATASGEFAGNITDVVATPWGSNTTKDYLAAGAMGNGFGADGGTVTIQFATAQTELDLLWGSVDFSDQNTVLELSNGVTITGLDVCQAAASQFGGIPATGSHNSCTAGTNSGDYDAFVALTGLGSFTSVTFSDDSQDAAFEFVPTAPASTPVPEPLTLSLFGAGLAGAGLIRRRKAKKA